MERELRVMVDRLERDAPGNAKNVTVTVQALREAVANVTRDMRSESARAATSNAFLPVTLLALARPFVARYLGGGWISNP